MLPYSKPPQLPPATAQSATSAEQRTNQPTIALAAGSGARVRYGVPDREKDREHERERERQRGVLLDRISHWSFTDFEVEDLAKPFIYPSPATLLSRPPDSHHASSSNPVSYPHSHALPHHHHHHHHHLHSHIPGQPGTVTGVPNTAASRDERTSFTSAPPKTAPVSTSTTTAGPPRRDTAGLGLGAGVGRGFGPGHGLFGNYREHEIRQRDRLERESQRERERERERDAPATPSQAETQTSKSMTTTGGSSIYHRPPHPPSPNVSRSIPAAPSASASPASNQQLASPQNVAATTTSTPRPNLPLPQFASLGSRSLPSPFENGRERTKNQAGQAEAPVTSHNRTPSNSGSRIESSVPAPVGVGQISPAELATLQSASRSLFSSAASNRGPRDRDPQRSSTTHTTSATDPTISPKSTNPPASQQSPYNFPSSFANNPNYNSSFMGFGGGFGYGAFGASWGKERIRGKDKDLERDRIRDTDYRPGHEKQIERHHLEEKEKPVVEVKPFQPPRQGTAFQDPYRRGYSRIEVLNQPEPPHQYPTTTESDVIPQVVPQREPRPYTYSARVESQSQRDREYSYTPREKRPRMDAAVEESAHRRGSVSKSKRKRDEEKIRSPVTVPPRDFSALTKEGKLAPEVTSSPVEAWLKTIPDLGRVIANQVYEGSDWTLAKTASTKGGCEGGVVMVRINGAFIGGGWVVRGQRAWDFAVPTLPVRGELCRGKDDRRVWGTDVYTDDSDLGLVLVHAGWIRWVESAVSDDHDGDVVYVTVRVVPGLVRYTATERNGVKSRGWGNGHDGLSIVVEGVSRATVRLP